MLCIQSSWLRMSDLGGEEMAMMLLWLDQAMVVLLLLVGWPWMVSTSAWWREAEDGRLNTSPPTAIKWSLLLGWTSQKGE